MTISTSRWLPPDALSPERVQPLLARIVDAWSGHWFAGARAAEAAAFRDNGPRETGWRSLPNVASIALTADASAAIAGAMIGATVPRANLRPGDRTIVEHLASTCADDLLRRLGEIASPGSRAVEIARGQMDLPDCSWWELLVGPEKRRVKLALARSTMIELIRRQLPAPDNRPLQSRRKGLAGQRIAIDAELGRCPISLADLQDLSIGDVLIVDRSTNTPVDVRVNGLASPLRAALESDEGMTALILAAPAEYPND
jgi:flagellar motor switch/type III secretory pathway protein FliN